MGSGEVRFEGWVGDDITAAEGKMVWKEFKPKTWEETDIDLKVTHSAVCGTDLHNLSSEMGPSPYPIVVGHEIVGVAVRVGSKTDGNIKVGDIVGVGAQADACLGRRDDCDKCAKGLENYCPHTVVTYGWPNVHLNGDISMGGGHALYHRAPGGFVFKLPEGLDPADAAPMLCGGITVYSPLKYFGAGPGKKVAVVGLGGLGHFAVMFAKALGAEVTGISRTESKRDEAKALGCDDYIATDDEEWVKKNSMRFDYVLSTLSSTRSAIDDYLQVLDVDGTMIQIGADVGPVPISLANLLYHRRRLVGSLIGNRDSIREMLQLAADTGIKPWIEKRPMKEANQTMLDLAANKARFRYVLVN